MASFSQLVLLGCVLSFGACITGERASPPWPLITRNLGCNSIGVIFTSDNWITQMNGKEPPRDIIQDEFLGDIMEDIAASATESGTNCTFNRRSYKLTCCDSGNLDKYKSVNRKEKTAAEKFWGHDISNVNFVFLLMNLFFFTFICSYGLMLAITSPETLLPLGQSESSENF